MEEYFLAVSRKFDEISSEPELRLTIISSIRLLLQQVVYGLAEWVAKNEPLPEQQPTKEILDGLLAPSDGTLVDALESLIISCEQLGWRGVSQVLSRKLADDSKALALCEGRPGNLIGLLNGIIQLRNDGAEGHGLLGGYRRDVESAAYIAVVNALRPLIPVAQESGDVLVGPNGNKISSSILRFIDAGSPVLIRKLKVIGTNTLKITTQFYDASSNKDERTHETENIFKSLGGRGLPRYRTGDNSWAPLFHIPERAEVFSGRQSQISSLIDWMNDTGSRACLVYGDGGFGKTSLVIEFVNRLLDEEISTEWKPKLITFYTAKRWQWGLNGLEPIGTGTPHLTDFIRHAYTLMTGTLPPAEYYRRDVASSAQALQEIMKTNVNAIRDEHLIIIDNAETLIESEDDRATLGKELIAIARRLGRVLVTSRRHEIFEANPIEVGPFSEEEAIIFLRARGKSLNIKEILKLNDNSLLAAIKDIELRPLALEVLLRLLTDPGVKGVNDAVNRLKGMLQRDLGEFLFADAWSRLSPEIRKLLLLMTSVADVSDRYLLRICADKVGVSLADAERSLKESSGIAGMSSVGGDFQIAFSPNFLEFVRGRMSSGSENKVIPTKDDISDARVKYKSLLESERKVQGIRNVLAHRTPVAKAALKAVITGNFSEARTLYDQATLSDMDNGPLKKSYADFLFRKVRDLPAAQHQSKLATDLLPDDSEAWFMRGMIESRLGKIKDCDISLERAESLGAQRIRCDIQRCWSYLKAKPIQENLGKSMISSIDAQLTHLPQTARERMEVDVLREQINSL